ncbi:MAG: hypothetical protein LC624_00025, partial [Halobacteriales archaeon]|nr:hypothetical protein [Halobacteriales archaeon]
TLPYRFGGDGCSFALLNSSGHACSLALGLGFALDGYVAIDAVGAQGTPLKLVDPTGRGSTLQAAYKMPGNVVLHGTNGSLPFAYDFIVPPGRPTTQLRVRLVNFQGEVLLDDLRVQPLTQPAVAFSGYALGAGASRNITDAKGELPQFATLKGASYRIVAQALPFDAAGKLVAEGVAGDDRAVTLTGPALGPGRIVVSKLVADPNNYNLSAIAGVPMGLLVTLRNEGAEEAEIQSVTGTLGDLAGHALFQGTQADFDPAPDSLTLGPLQEQSFRWAFLPESTTPAGVYRFGVEVATQGARIAPDSGDVLVYIGSDFHSQFGSYWPVSNLSQVDDKDLMWPCDATCTVPLPSMAHWSSDGVFNKAYPPTNACHGVGQPTYCIDVSASQVHGLQWYFHKTAAENLSAFRSFHLIQDTGSDECIAGGDDGGGAGTCGWFQDGQNGLYLGTLFAAVHSPAIPIAYMQRPQLIYADRHQFNALDADGNIFARLVHCEADALHPDDVPCKDTSTVFPTGQCENQFNVHGWQLVDAHIQGSTPASPGFAANKWVLRSVDLGPLLDRAQAESKQALDYWDHVQVCWHLEQPSPRDGAVLLRDWAIDDVFITPYGTALSPAQDIPIGDNVTKEFHLALLNRGGYTDTYQVSLQDETGLPSKGPSNWRVELLDEQGRPLKEVRAQPGERRVITVRVHIDVAQPSLPREGQVDLAITAISKTTAFLRGTQHLLLHFTYPDRPNLRVAGVIINDATLAVDKPRTVDVIVQNTGTVPAVGARLDVLDKVDASFGVAPVPLKRVDGTDIPPFDLAPADLRVVTVNWVPSLDGEHNITAIVDPLAEILEFDEKDNVFTKAVQVPKAEFPDLLVEAHASQLNPTPGDVVDIQARITNKGGASADGVQVTMRAGVTDLLSGDPPHVLPDSIPPGGTVTLSVSFRAAFPGQQFIFVRAVPRAGVLERLETIDDNTAVITVSVRSRGLDAAVPLGLTVKPGGTVNATLTLLNRGDVDDAYDVQLIPPDNWRSAFGEQGEGVHVAIGNHSQANLSLSITAPPFAEAGPVIILLRGASENTTEVMESGIQVDVPQDFGLRFSVDDGLLLPPGDQFLPVHLVNKGNGVDTVTVRATSLPAGWALEPASFGVPPKSSITVRLNVSIPTTTPEGPYPLALQAQGRGGDLLPAQAQVQVLPLELLRLEVQGLPEMALPGAQLQGLLVVRNAGNLPAHADLSLLVPAGWQAHLARDIASMEPGEQRALPVSLDVPQGAASGEHRLQAVAASGRGANYTLHQVLRAARADLQVEGFDLQPKGALREGNVATIGVTVRNNGNAPAPGTVAVYLDNTLVGFDAGRDLQPGEAATLNVSFKVQHGEHVVLAAVDPGKAVGEDDEDNNAVVRVLHVESGGAFFAVPGLEPMLAVAALLAVAVLRRRAWP